MTQMKISSQPEGSYYQANNTICLRKRRDYFMHVTIHYTTGNNGGMMSSVFHSSQVVQWLYTLWLLLHKLNMVWEVSIIIGLEVKMYFGEN